MQLRKNCGVKTTGINIWFWGKKLKITESLNCNMLTSYSFFLFVLFFLKPLGRREMFGGPGTREKRRQTDHGAHCHVCHWHACNLDGVSPFSLPYFFHFALCWRHSDYNGPQEHMQVIHHSKKNKRFEGKSHWDDKDRGNSFLFKLWIEGQKQINEWIFDTAR